ncbi:MAG: RNA polymerase sigma factor FliA [Gallionellaceae bacterium]|nr:RNA polymerase sigma factor FliA [Gallionellaceae bacterium]
MSNMEGPTDKDAVIRAHLPLVKRIAYHLMSRLPASVDADDLIQAGLIGLLDAMDRFDDSQGAHFETYATQRVRGAMLDELRESDWASRTVRKASRKIENAIHALQQRLQRQPTEQEIAGQLGMPINDYFELLGETRGAQLVYYEDLHASDSDDFLDRFVGELADGPFEMLSDQNFRKALTQAIVELPDREKMLMGMYYEQEMNFKEIGAVLGVSESRICQLHGQAVARLRGFLRDWVN